MSGRENAGLDYSVLCNHSLEKNKEKNVKKTVVLSKERNYAKLLELRNKKNLAIHHLGIEIKDAGPGWAKGEMIFQKYHLNPIGSVHGGMLFALADSVGGTAACTRGSYVTTSNASIHYLNAAINPKMIIAEAVELKAGKNLLTYDVTVKTETDIVVAKVTLEYFSLHKEIDF